MRAGLTAFLLTIGTASAAFAGAWPRDVGTVFVSLSHATSIDMETIATPYGDLDHYTSLYAEYGLTENYTVGFEAGRGSGEENRSSSALAFVRRPVWRSDHRGLASVELGFGMLDEPEDETQMRLRSGVAWGLGFQEFLGGGWLGLEGWVEARLPAGEVAIKATATTGFKPGKRTMLIGQVHASRAPDNDLVVRLAPSYVRRITSKTHLQLGATGDVSGGKSVGLKIAVWVNF